MRSLSEDVKWEGRYLIPEIKGEDTAGDTPLSVKLWVVFAARNLSRE